jgi:hypothetical protein
MQRPVRFALLTLATIAAAGSISGPTLAQDLMCNSVEHVYHCVEDDGTEINLPACQDVDSHCTHADGDYVYSDACRNNSIYTCENIVSCACPGDDWTICFDDGKCLLDFVIWPESEYQQSGGSGPLPYKVGDVIRYEGLDYVCRLEHVPQVGWEPPNTPNLWARINTSGIWAPQVIYNTGDLVTHGPRVYRALQGHQALASWAPPSTPSLWAPVWKAQDVGAVAATGELIQSGDTLRVKGSGADLYGSADEFHFAFKDVSGNATIKARVASIEHVNNWSKAALVMRDGLSAGARNVALVASPVATNKYRWQVRSSAGGSTTSTSGPSGIVNPGTAPVWLKIVRNGSTFTGYFSSNNQDWTLIGSKSMSLPTTIQVGVGVTSHDDGDLARGVFEDVSITTP